MEKMKLLVFFPRNAAVEKSSRLLGRVKVVGWKCCNTMYVISIPKPRNSSK